MVDTLRLQLHDVEFDFPIQDKKVTNIDKIKIIPKVIPLDLYQNSEYDNPVLFQAPFGEVNTDTGEIGYKEIRGDKAIINDDLFNFTRKNVVTYQDGIRIYDVVQCSIPKLINNQQANIGNYDNDAFIYGLETLQEKLKDNGVVVKNIFNSDILRVDLFNDIILEDKFYNYHEYFNSLVDGRKKRINYNNETFLFFNKTSEFTIYDKIEELKARNIDVANLSPNIARCEARFKKKQNIKDIFGINTVNDLDINNTKPILKGIGEKYFNQVGAYQVTYNVSSLLENIEIYKSLYGRSYFTNYLRDFALMIHKNSLSYDGLMQVLTSAFTHRQKVSKYKKIVDSINLPIQQIDKNKIYHKFVEDYFKNIA